MRKLFVLSFNVLCAVILLFSSAFAWWCPFWGSKSKKNPTKQDCIYACVEKMDSSQSDESNYTIDTNVNDEYDFIPYSSIDARGVLPPHHCFFAHAVENLTKGNGQFRWLDLKDTIGFGTRENATKRLKVVFGKTCEAAAYAENPSILRSREYIENRQVSCEPMFCEEDLTKEYIKKFDGNGTRAMRHYWTDTEGLVIEKVGNKYRLYRWYGKPDEDGYNCCGVVESVSKKIGGRKEVIYKITQVNYGIGTGMNDPL